jgi:hypothetical protein
MVIDGSGAKRYVAVNFQHHDGIANGLQHGRHIVK